MKYLSLKKSESILASQLQFGTYEAESEHFRLEKEKRYFNKRLLCFSFVVVLHSSMYSLYEIIKMVLLNEKGCYV